VSIQKVLFRLVAIWTFVQVHIGENVQSGKCSFGKDVSIRASIFRKNVLEPSLTLRLLDKVMQ